MRSHQVIQESVEATQLNIHGAANSFSSLSEDQIRWKINPDSWSIGECLSHLINSNGLYLKKFKELLTSKSSLPEKDFPYYQSFSGKMITKGVDLANLKKSKTFKPFFPDLSNLKKEVINNYIKSSEEFILLTEKMKNLNLRKIKLSSPANIFIRMNLGDPLIFIPKHDERHLNQAERVKNHEQFPHG